MESIFLSKVEEGVPIASTVIHAYLEGVTGNISYIVTLCRPVGAYICCVL